MILFWNCIDSVVFCFSSLFFIIYIKNQEEIFEETKEETRGRRYDNHEKINVD
jgi:hypothetical protein